jgi:hypothetical protein
MCEPRNGEHGWSGSHNPHRAPRNLTTTVLVGTGDQAEDDEENVDVRDQRETPEYTGGS